MIIIGLSGKIKSGKDTVCTICKQIVKVPVERLAFADGVKQEVSQACKVSVEFIEQNKELFRPMLQWWGTTFRRKITIEDYWIKKMMRKIVELPNEIQLVIITDVRFLNEVEFIKSIGGYVFRVERNSGVGDTHISETILDDYKGFDGFIFNDDTTAKLMIEVRSMINTVNELNKEKEVINV